MSLEQELRALTERGRAQAPAQVQATLQAAQQALAASGILDRVLRPGQVLPAFELADATGRRVSSEALLAQGPLLLNFYRGEWCPFCNLALRALQGHLPHFQRHGVQLVAVSPERPDHSLSLAEKHGLAFPVLSDPGLALARQCGIVFALDERLRPLYQAWGVDLPERNGSDSFELPLPAVFLVGRDGTVLESFAEIDYRLRLEPDTALGWIDRHFGPGEGLSPAARPSHRPR